MTTTPRSTRLAGWRRAVGLVLGLSVLALGLSPGAAEASAPACGQTFTVDADFDQGALLNLNHDPDHDQLQLNATTEPFPFVYIANSARGTAVRIDVNSGEILGEFLTSPAGMGRNPSRTTVDKLGNVWVSNRDESSGGRGSVVRIGLLIGGTRGTVVDGTFTADPAGDWVAPPFVYDTCIDKDGDGYVKTSRGLGDIRPWSNAGFVDKDGGVSTAEDECIINYTRVAGTYTRTVAVDANNDVWVGGMNTAHEKLSGVTGQPIPGTQFNLQCGGYGGLVDGNNVLWSAQFGQNLLRFDATTMTGKCLDLWHGNYGLGIDPSTGHIWHTTYGDWLYPNGAVVELASDGSVLGAYPHGYQYAQGVAVDGIGNVWVAHSLASGTSVGHLLTDGSFVGNVPLPGGQGPTGVAVDANGKVWVANIYTDNAMRIDPKAGPLGPDGVTHVGEVDLVVNLGPGAGPYNYSDMTGFVAIGATTPTGTWTVVHDGGTPGNAWGTLSWTSAEPAGTSVRLEVRAADAQADLPSQTFVAVENGASFCGQGVAGRFVEIRATLSRTVNAVITPILYDATLGCCNQPPVAVCADRTVEADAQCLGAASIDDGSYDPDGDAITLAQVPPGPFALGTTPATLTVTDPLGAAATCSASVSVLDLAAPTVACPAPATVSADAACQALAPDLGAGLVAGDNCTPAGSLVVVQDPPAGTPLGLGTHTIAVTVTDQAGNSAGCSSTLTVVDDSMPAIGSSVATASLWPPNHELVNVGFTAAASDNCADAPPLAVVVYADEDDEMATGDGNHSPDARDVASGTLRLRAERMGTADGRVYLLLAEANDAAGNTTFSCSTVVVPRSQSAAHEAAVAAQAAEALAYCQANGAAPAGFVVVGDGPVIGPKQ